MGTQSLITGTFNGRVGSIVGSKNTGGAYIKARTFSKTPNNETQTAALLAFGHLQRLAAGIAKITKRTPFVTGYHGSYFNAVSHKFRNCIVDNAFDITAAETIFKTVDPYSLALSTVDLDKGTLTATITAPTTAIEQSARQIALLVLNSDTTCVAHSVETAEVTTRTLNWQASTLTDGYLLAFEIIKNTAENLPLSINRRKFPYVWRNLTLTELL